MDNYANILNGKGNAGGLGSNNRSTNITRSVWTGVVISNEDEFDGNRLRVRIAALDKGIEDTDIALICDPLIPTFNTILPKKGEAVRVILCDVSKPYSLRLWVGPVISQFQNIDEDPIDTALCLTNEAKVQPQKPIKTIKNAEKIFPVTKNEKENVNQIGRNNTIIKHRDNELTVSTGRHIIDKNTELNETNPSILKQKLSTLDDKTTQSSTVVMSDIIALLSHKGNKVTKNNYEIDDQDIETIKTDGYSLLKAEPMIDFLKELIQYLCVTHNHPFTNLPPSSDLEAAKKLINFDFDSVISKNHKIN